MLVLTLVALVFCVAMYFSLQSHKAVVSTMADTINVIQKNLNNIVPDIRSLLEYEHENLTSLAETIYSVKHEIGNLKKEFEKNGVNEQLEDIKDEVNEQLTDIKNGILKIEKYLINQFKFNDVLAKAIAHHNSDMAYVRAKLTHNFPEEMREATQCNVLQSLFSYYHKSNLCTAFSIDNESKHCYIFLDFAGIGQIGFFDAEITAKTLIRASTGHYNAYYTDNTQLIYDNLRVGEGYYGYSSELESNKLSYDEDSHIDPESSYVIKKGIQVSAYIIEQKLGHSASYQKCRVEVISVKQNINDDGDDDYQVILEVTLNPWSLNQEVVTRTITVGDEDEFPCIDDDQYEIALILIDPTESPVPTESFGAEDPLPLGFDPRKPTLIRYGNDYWFYGNTDGNKWKTQKLELKTDSILQRLYVDFSTMKVLSVRHPQSMSICNYISSIQAHTVNEAL